MRTNRPFFEVTKAISADGMSEDGAVQGIAVRNRRTDKTGVEHIIPTPV